MTSSATDSPRPGPSARSVLGPVPVDELGFILPHEHVAVDNSIHHVAHDGIDPEAIIEQKLLGELRVRPHAVRANLVLDEEETVAAELERYRALGGGTLVELTPLGMGRDLELMVRLARRTGVTIIAGTGWYVQRGHGGLVSGRPLEELAEALEHDLAEASPGAGVIGEIGISAEPHPDEWRVLDAALLAQRRTGAAIWIHQTTTAPTRAILERLSRADADLGRIVLCHVDYDLRDISDQYAALAMGLVLEMDLFGFPAWNRRNFVHFPDDTLRLERLLELAADGFEAQLLMSQDVCMKTQLVRYGGYGYGHLLANVHELFERLDGSAGLWQQMTHRTPARLLAPG